MARPGKGRTKLWGSGILISNTWRHGACRRHGAKVFAQLFHPGREILATTDGLMAVAYAPSEVPNERFHIMPRAMGERRPRPETEDMGWSGCPW